MALNTAGPLSRIAAVLTSLSGLQSAYVGVPESVGPQVAAYVALAGQEMITEVSQIMQRKASYFVGFVYAVAGAEATAETTIAGLLDAFLVALLTERSTGMNSGSGAIVDNVDWDFSLSDSPGYAPIAGLEFRLYPVLVTVTQHVTYG